MSAGLAVSRWIEHRTGWSNTSVSGEGKRANIVYPVGLAEPSGRLENLNPAVAFLAYPARSVRVVIADRPLVRHQLNGLYFKTPVESGHAGNSCHSAPDDEALHIQCYIQTETS